MSSKGIRAALDIGSNTIRLLVARLSSRGLDPIEDVSEFVRLGKGVDETGELQADRIRAGVDAIGRLRSRAVELGAPDVVAIATSAVRDARNRADLVERVERETGIQIRVLSGDEEAYLTYLGATMGRSLQDGAVVCDLGGGSAELIFATEDGIQWSQSLQLGSGRLTEQFVRHDPPQPDELGAVRRHTQELLRGLPPADAATTLLTGGTASHIAWLAGREGVEVELTPDEIEGVARLVGSQSVEHLVNEHHVQPARAEVLAAGVNAAAAIVQFYDTRSVVITRRGIREGTILDAEE